MFITVKLVDLIPQLLGNILVMNYSYCGTYDNNVVTDFLCINRF